MINEYRVSKTLIVLAIPKAQFFIYTYKGGKIGILCHVSVWELNTERPVDRAIATIHKSTCVHMFLDRILVAHEAYLSHIFIYSPNDSLGRLSYHYHYAKNM